MFEGKPLYVAIAQCRKDRRLELEKYIATCQPQSLYPSSSNVIAPPIGSLYYNFSTVHPAIPFLQQPFSYQNFGANMGVQYPLGAENYQQQFYVRILFYVTNFLWVDICFFQLFLCTCKITVSIGTNAPKHSEPLNPGLPTTCKSKKKVIASITVHSISLSCFILTFEKKTHHSANNCDY